MGQDLPDLTLSNKTALVTGGGAGIGRGIATMLSAAGAHVIVTDVNHESADETAELCRDAGGLASAFLLDVTDSSAVEDVCREIVSEIGLVSILINNAGVVSLSRFLEMPIDDFDRIIDVSLKGTYLMTRGVLPQMHQQSWGRIISISSMMGKTPAGYAAHYAAAKAGIIGFTQSIAKEVGPNITVNCLCPGNIETAIVEHDYKFFSDRYSISPEELRQQWIEEVPLGRLGEPSDVARAVLVLATETGQYTTGQAINVSGGLEIH